MGGTRTRGNGCSILTANKQPTAGGWAKMGQQAKVRNGVECIPGPENTHPCTLPKCLERRQFWHKTWVQNRFCQKGNTVHLRNQNNFSTHHPYSSKVLVICAYCIVITRSQYAVLTSQPPALDVAASTKASFHQTHTWGLLPPLAAQKSDMCWSSLHLTGSKCAVFCMNTLDTALDLQVQNNLVQ